MSTTNLVQHARQVLQNAGLAYENISFESQERFEARVSLLGVHGDLRRALNNAGAFALIMEVTSSEAVRRESEESKLYFESQAVCLSAKAEALLNIINHH